MNVLGFLEVIAPSLLKQADSDRLTRLIEIAENYRPTCLPVDKQEIAVAYYVAYLLASSQETEINPFGVVSEREGDLSRSYGAEQSASAKFYAKWQEMNEVCVRVNGSITVGLNCG